jgi:phenylalanyl-tRNA synthetase beta chain
MMNNLSADLDVLRPSMLETGLESLAYNLNRRNNNLQLFEFGKTYHSKAVGHYNEQEHLCLYITGANHDDVWNEKSKAFNFYTTKGITQGIVALVGFGNIEFKKEEGNGLIVQVIANKKQVATIVEVGKTKLQQFDIKQPVYFIDFNFTTLVQLVTNNKISYKEVTKFPTIQRDLAMVVNKNISFDAIEATIQKTKLNKLQQVRLFDVFESEKLGADKKSMAVNFTFLDEEKTLTDKEIDGMMNKLVQQFENELSAEIRK